MLPFADELDLIEQSEVWTANAFYLGAPISPLQPARQAESHSQYISHATQRENRESPFNAQSRDMLLHMTNLILQVSQTIIPCLHFLLAPHRLLIYLLALRPLRPRLRPLHNFGLNIQATTVLRTSPMIRATALPSTSRLSLIILPINLRQPRISKRRPLYTHMSNNLHTHFRMKVIEAWVD